MHVYVEGSRYMAVQGGPAQCGVVLHSVKRSGAAQSRPVQCGVVQCSAVQCGAGGAVWAVLDMCIGM